MVKNGSCGCRNCNNMVATAMAVVLESAAALIAVLCRVRSWLMVITFLKSLQHRTEETEETRTCPRRTHELKDENKRFLMVSHGLCC